MNQIEIDKMIFEDFKKQYKKYQKEKLKEKLFDNWLLSLMSNHKRVQSIWAIYSGVIMKDNNSIFDNLNI